MNYYSTYKYFLVSNIKHDGHIPFDVVKIIVVNIHNSTVRVFSGDSKIIIITSKGLYCLDNKISSDNGKPSVNSHIDIYNIKNIILTHKWWYLLYNSGSVYRVNKWNDKYIHVIDDIETISGNLNACFISKTKDLYVCGLRLPKCFGDCRSVTKTKFTNVKQVLCYKDEITVLFDDGRILHYDDYYSYLDLQFIDQISRGKNYLFGVNRETIYTYELHPDIIDSKKEFNDMNQFNNIDEFGDVDEYNSDNDLIIKNSDMEDANFHIRPDEDLIIKNFDNSIKMIGCCKNSIFILNVKGELYSCISYSVTDFERQWCNKMPNELIKFNLPSIESIHYNKIYMIAVTIYGDIYGWGKLFGKDYLRIPVRITL